MFALQGWVISTRINGLMMNRSITNQKDIHFIIFLQYFPLAYKGWHFTIIKTFFLPEIDYATEVSTSQTYQFAIKISMTSTEDAAGSFVSKNLLINYIYSMHSCQLSINNRLFIRMSIKLK